MVLVRVCAEEDGFLPVEVEAVVQELRPAEAERGFKEVDGVALAVVNGRIDAVEVGLVRAPEFDVLDVVALGVDHRRGVSRHNRGIGGKRCHQRVVGRIDHLLLDHNGPRRVGVILYLGLHAHIGALLRDVLADLLGRRVALLVDVLIVVVERAVLVLLIKTGVVQGRGGDRRAIPGHVDAVRDVEVYVPVDAAGEVVVAGARVLLGVPLVVHAHSDDVLPSVEVVGDVKGKAGIAAVMGAHGLPVDKDLCFDKSAFKLNADALAAVQPLLRDVEGLAVHAVAHKEIGLHIIGDAEAVGQADVGPFGVVKRRVDCAAEIRGGIVRDGLALEFPLAVEIDLLPGRLRGFIGVPDGGPGGQDGLAVDGALLRHCAAVQRKHAQQERKRQHAGQDSSKPFH